jgi:hypothetical protein
MKSYERLNKEHNSDIYRDHFATLNEWFLRISEKLGFQENEWLCLMDCLNGFYFYGSYEVPLAFAIEAEIEDTAQLEPTRFAQWDVDLNTLLSRIRPLNELQTFALLYRVQWMFLVPDEEKFTI